MLRQRVNQALASVTGYQLSRAVPPPVAEAAQRPQPQDSSQAEQSVSPTKKPGPKKRAAQKKAVQERTEKRAARQAAAAVAAAKPPGDGLPVHYDEAAKATILRVRPRTMTRHEKLYGLVQATRYVVAQGVEGDIVECGVWRGGSMQAVALTLAEVGGADRDLHLYDTFEGMPPPSDKDRRFDGVAAKDLMETSERTKAIWAIATLDDVQAGMAETGYPAERVHYHPGRVEETIPSQAPDRIAILRLDTDWYESTLHELRELYDRISPGGVLIIDDYGHWEGARQATEQFLAESGAPLLMLALGSGRIAVKPGLPPGRRLD